MSSQDFEQEAKELDTIQPVGAKNYFAPLFPENVYNSFSKILSFARDLNVQVPIPEIVVIGKQGHAKSSLIEAILGFSLLQVGTGAAGTTTKRPIFISLVSSNAEKIILRRDLTVEGADRDIEVELKDVPSQLEKRLQKASNSPIYLQIEAKNCINITLIDSPGLEFEGGEEKASASETEQAILSLVRPAHRHIICVEEAQDWSALKMINFIKKVDPSLTRSTFVLTKFNQHLKSLNATIKLNRYLASQPRDVQCFFVSLFSDKTRANNLATDKFQEKIYQAYKLDKNFVDALQFDKRFAPNIGLHNLRRFIQQLAWKNYQSGIPEILKKLRGVKRDSQLKLQKLQALMGQLNASKLRTIATNYVVSFLQIIEKLIAGTAEGNPSVNGQTLQEEKNYGIGEWFDNNYQEITVVADQWNIPYWNSRLYGGQQFERLIAEFRAVVQHTKIPEITLDDIATAAGVNKLNNLPNYAYSGCDIAQQKIREQLGTLIDQLTKRATYIMKRLTSVVQKIMESRKKQLQAGSSIEITTSLLDDSAEDFDKFPYFVYHVKDLFNEFVDQTAERVREKCMDEFYSTATIYWSSNEMQDLVKQADIPADSSDTEKVKNSVTKLATIVFEDVKNRIAKNVMLKFYNFFLIPMQTSLWNAIQETVTCLSDQALAEIFEVNVVKEKLSEDENELKHLLENSNSQEQEFLKSSTIFSHPVQNKLENDDDDKSGAAAAQGAKPQGSSAPPSILGM